jgi:hypothetical protein
MLRVEYIQRFFRFQKYVILDGDLPIGEIKLGARRGLFKSSWELSIGGSFYKIYVKPVSLRSAIKDYLPIVFLEENGNVLARAELKPGDKFIPKDEFLIEYAGNQYILKKKPTSWWRLLFGHPPMILLHGYDQIGSVEYKSFGATIDLPESIPIFLRVLIFHLAMRYWSARVAPGF